MWPHANKKGTLALAHGKSMPSEKSPRDTPPAMPLKDSANCSTGPSRSTANTRANETAPHAMHTHRAIYNSKTLVY